MAVADATRRGKRLSLIQGTDMICPRCKTKHNVLRYVPMGLIEEFKAETNPIYKCPSCRWIFSPAEGLISDDIVEAMLNA